MSTNTDPVYPIDLEGFTGGYETSELVRFNLFTPRILCTPGVKYLANKAQCWWLLDVIASYYKPGGKSAVDRQLWEDSILFWTVEKTGSRKAVVYCQQDSGMPKIIRQEIPHTDFPFPIEGKVRLWVAEAFPDGTMESKHKLIILPSEY